MLIEHTAKHWKAIQAVGGLVMFVGVVLACLFMVSAYHLPISERSHLAVPVAASSVITLAGVAVYLVGRVAAWWNHG